jgi:enterochelin esterase-like enzyme
MRKNPLPTSTLLKAVRSTPPVLILVLAALLALAACSPPAAPPQPENLPEQSTPTPGSRLTGLPASTLQPDPTASPALGGTSTPGVTQPPPALSTPGTVSRTQAPTPTSVNTGPACRERSGRFETGELKSSLLRDPLEYRVYLPPCYGTDPQARYPVLYLIHGQSYNDDQWQRLGAGETASALISSGEVAPFLIVMPRDRVWSQPSEDNFGRAVIQDLLPHIDSHYATRPEREYRAVGGLSRGAGWAVHLGISHWELFGALGGHSLPVFWEDTVHIRSWLEQIPDGQMPRIYLDIGSKDRPEILNSAVWFENLLTQLNVAHEWYLFQGYHEEKYWAENLERYLRWYAAPWGRDG